jgi:hypothetical protein
MTQCSQKRYYRIRESLHVKSVHASHLAQPDHPPFQLQVLHLTRRGRPALHLDYQSLRYLRTHGHHL